MFVIGKATVDDDVMQAAFCCDLAVCKGVCCCIEGGRGAPLEDGEVREIEKAFPVIRRFLSPASLRAIEAGGLVEGAPGDYVTMCVDRKECVFAYFEDGTARCSFERAFEEGLNDWPKPISCHLFPIRADGSGGNHLRYERIEECHSGRRRGESRRIMLCTFLKDPLIRKFGRPWYEKFLAERVHVEGELSGRSC